MAGGGGLRIRGWSQAACAREGFARMGEGGVPLSRILSLSLDLSFSLSHALSHSLPTPLERARAFGIRGGVETRADSQSLAVRSTTWLESAAWPIEINDNDDGGVMPILVNRSWPMS